MEGPIFWGLEDAFEIMQWYRDFLPKAPEEFCPFLGLKTVPSTAPFPENIWGRKIVALINCYNGPQEKGEEVMKPIRKELPPPIFEHVGMMPYPVIQSLFDPLLPKGMQWYWRGDFVKDLPDPAIRAHIEQIGKSPSELSLMHLYPINGAVHRVNRKDTAWNYRDATWSMVIAGIDPDPAKADAISKWTKNYWEAVHPYSMGGAYINFMMEEGQDPVMATYGDNYQKLVSIKKKYDPDNLFRVNQNIKPAG